MCNRLALIYVNNIFSKPNEEKGLTGKGEEVTCSDVFSAENFGSLSRGRPHSMAMA
jgi:hypothetical protein